MLIASLTFSNLAWAWLAAAALLLGLGLLAWNYRHTPGLTRWSGIILKSLGLAALCLCLLEPLWSGHRARPGANLFAVLADNSQGMHIKGAGSALSRADSLKAILDPDKARWPAELAHSFDVRRYLFDTRLQAVNSFSELNFQGPATALGSALRTVSDRFRNRPLAGVLLFTDGNATDLKGLPDLSGLPPIYPVVPGGADTILDLGVQQVRATQTVFEDAPVTVHADVLASGVSGQTVVGQLRDPTGQVVGEQSLKPAGKQEQLSFVFQLRPATHGVLFYDFQTRLQDEMPQNSRAMTGSRSQRPAQTNDVPSGNRGLPASAPSSEPPSREATLLNNSAVVAVDRGQGPYRVLYVSGRPNWEFKFLNRAVEEDKEIELVALIRIARREPKFSFLGRAGETSNPLYRGFGNQSPENVERYDQPVLARFNTRDDRELQGGFPRTPEDLFAYHAIIIDDLEAEFFTPDQALLLQRFVSERGGGLLMLGGMESFQEGKYQRTPVGDLLPVYLDRPAPAPRRGELRLDLTREGWLQTWVRLRDNEADERTRLKTAPALAVLNPLGEIKPGATVALTASDEQGNTFPALVTQRFGRGRSAALPIGDLWRWGFHDADQRKDMDKAWRQLVRWLVSEVPARVEITAGPKTEDPNGAVALETRVREANFLPADDARVTVEIEPWLPPGPHPAASTAVTNLLRLRAEASSSEAGLHELTYIPRQPGGYRATTYATNAAGAYVGRAVTGWATDLAAAEFRSFTPNLGLLQDIARKTGGQVVTPDQLPNFVRDLPKRTAPVMEAWTFPVWHTPAMFLFALLCLISEWGLRRSKGLP